MGFRQDARHLFLSLPAGLLNGRGADVVALHLHCSQFSRPLRRLLLSLFAKSYFHVQVVSILFARPPPAPAPVVTVEGHGQRFSFRRVVLVLAGGTRMALEPRPAHSARASAAV
ncbi:MAG: hypothetical protein ACK55Z_04170, partial [bacterium]